MTMTAAVGQWRATYEPGDSLVLAGPTSLVLLKDPDTSQEKLVNALWEQVIRSASMTEMAARLAVFSIDKLPGFAAFFWTANGMRSLVRGDVTVTDPSTGDVIANGSGIQTWTEIGLAELTRVSASIDQEARPGPSLPLVVGAVQASSVVLDASPEVLVASPQASADQLDAAPVSLIPAAQLRAEELWGPDDGGPDTEPMSIAELDEQTAGDTATPQPDSSSEDLLESDTALMAGPHGGKPFDPFDPQLFAPHQAPAAQAAMPPPVAPDVETPPTLADTTPPATPEAEAVDTASAQSMIMAADCPYGHSNPPTASTCRLCGTDIPRQDPRLVRRPVLCVLRANDGTSVEVDRAVLVGRAPDAARSHFESPRLMTLHSREHDISRTHVEVAPDGWQVVVTDLNSTNGTVLIQPDGQERHQLPPGRHVPVHPGSVLELGDGVSLTIALPA
jgi:hypothetical protein